jgi:hypothetical protein
MNFQIHGAITNVNITSPIGQKLKADSIPVVISSDQIVPSTITSPIGQKLKADSIPVVISSDQILQTDVKNTLTDAFGRVRVSNPQTLYDSKQLADNQPLFWDDAETVGSGTSSTYNTNQSSTTLAVSAITMGTRVRQTKQRFNYQPGKSQQIFMTFNMHSSDAGITKRLGYFDQKNGVLFESMGTSLYMTVRTFTSGSATDIQVEQSNWNIDSLDGTGISGITLDISKTQILIIDFEWLGVGSIRIGFVINGIIYYVHMFQNANINTVVYMSIPNLPCRYEISNDGTGAVSSLTHICSSVSSEGGVNITGMTRSVDRGSTGFATLANSSYYPILAIRLKSTHLFATINILNITILNTTTSTFLWKLWLNPTVVGTALSFSELGNSAIEYSNATTNATTLTDGSGIILISSYDQDANFSRLARLYTPSVTDLKLGSTIAGVSDIIVVAVAVIDGGAETFYASLIFTESW